MSRVLLLLVCLFAASDPSFSQEINELPMYGGKPKTPELIKIDIDQHFIHDLTKKMPRP